MRSVADVIVLPRGLRLRQRGLTSVVTDIVLPRETAAAAPRARRRSGRSRRPPGCARSTARDRAGSSRGVHVRCIAASTRRRSTPPASLIREGTGMNRACDSDRARRPIALPQLRVTVSSDRSQQMKGSVEEPLRGPGEELTVGKRRRRSCSRPAAHRIASDNTADVDGPAARSRRRCEEQFQSCLRRSLRDRSRVVAPWH